MRSDTKRQAEGKETPSLGSGVPSPAAVGLTGAKDLVKAIKESPQEWNQKAGETDRAYLAFRHCVQLGRERSLVKATEGLGRSIGMLPPRRRGFGYEPGLLTRLRSAERGYGAAGVVPTFPLASPPTGRAKRLPISSTQSLPGRA
jgi:hypothetical protein